MPFGIKSYSDFSGTTSNSPKPSTGLQCLSASSPIWTRCYIGYTKAESIVFSAFRHQVLFGLCDNYDELVVDLAQSSVPFGIKSYSDVLTTETQATVRASSVPFGIKSYSDQHKKRKPLCHSLVFSAFRHQVLFGRHTQPTHIYICIVFSAFRHQVLFGLVLMVKLPIKLKESSVPFGIKSYSDMVSTRGTILTLRWSSVPFGIKSYSDYKAGLLYARPASESSVPFGIKSYLDKDSTTTDEFGRSSLQCLSASGPIRTETKYDKVRKERASSVPFGIKSYLDNVG